MALDGMDPSEIRARAINPRDGHISIITNDQMQRLLVVVIPFECVAPKSDSNVWYIV